jgi:hypothetical protein
VSPIKAAGGSPRVTNNASDEAFVGVQGIVNGDVRVNYEAAREDPPETKFQVAKSRLDGSMPRRAAELIKEVVEAGYTTNEVAYYWSVAVLSGRSFELLEEDELTDLRCAYDLSDKNRTDNWQNALDVVARLVNCLLAEEKTGSHDSAGFDEFLHAYGQLPDVRRDEIRRHLDVILTGSRKDRMDAESADDVRTQRMGKKREERVWKFFEPVPEPPRPKPLGKPALAAFPRTMAVGGAILAGAGLLLAFTLAFRGGVNPAIIAALLVGGGGYAVARLGPVHLPSRFSTPRPESTEFSDYVEATIQREFAEYAPEEAFEKVKWAAAIHKIKTTLGHDIVDSYTEPEVAPGSVDWLIKWHAEETARRWAAGELEYRDRILAPVGFVLGAIALAVGSLVLLSDMASVQIKITGVALAWLAAGVLLMVESEVDVHLVRLRDHPSAKAAIELRLAQETKAYETWSDELKDRPTDLEMARWLDYDKIYLKTLAMNQYGLPNRDVIAHAILTEAGKNCRRARVKNGLPRYDAYIAWVFLLTASGVRQVAVHLDFATGMASNQQRTTFRYDAIASARVTEIGIRFDGGQREIILPSGDDRKGKTKTSALIFYQAFRLALMDGRTIDVDVTSLDEWLLDPARDDETPPPIPDTSDLAGALQILEAVAADGREWIAKAKARHGRTLLHDAPSAGPTNGRPAGLSPALSADGGRS